MESYLHRFHDEYVNTADRFLSEEQRARLIRYAWLPAPIVGYVSTKLGAGYEYEIEGSPGITVRRGSQRIEELWAGAPRSVMKAGSAVRLNGIGITIQQSPDISDLEHWPPKGGFVGAFPFYFTADPADVTLIHTSFQAPPWRRDVRYAFLATTRTAEYWSEAEAVRRAKDEILVAMVDVQQSARYEVDLGTYLGQFKERTVLLLGDFNHGRERLAALREALDRLDYSTVLLDEVPESAHYDLRQKFQAVAPVCRFLVFDDSSPAGQMAELVLAQGLNAICVVLREGETGSSFMTSGLELTSRVIREWQYNATTVDATVVEATEWAEQQFASLAVERSTLYPWRG